MLVHIVYKLACVISMYGYVCMWGVSAGGCVCVGVLYCDAVSNHFG